MGHHNDQLTTIGEDELLDTSAWRLPTEYEDCIVPGGVIALDGDPLDWPVEDRPLIYVAGYYAACPSQGVANAAQWAAKLTEVGWNAFVPHFSFLYDMVMPMPASYWYAYDIALLARCDAMFVCPDTLTMDSKGVAKEIDFALRHDIPVLYEVVEAKDRYNR
jgi:hypothetical protein